MRVDASNVQWTVLLVISARDYVEPVHNVFLAKVYSIFLWSVAKEEHLYRCDLVHYFLFEQFARAEIVPTCSLLLNPFRHNLLHQRAVEGVREQKEAPIICGMLSNISIIICILGLYLVHHTFH